MGDISEEENDWDTKPLREMLQIAGGNCCDCAKPFLATDALNNIAMGFKSAPRCFGCLVARLERDEEAVKRQLAEFIQRQQCFYRAWEVAEQMDGDNQSNTQMRPREKTVRGRWNAGELGCGELLLALGIRLKELAPGSLFSLRAADAGAPQDLPAWCRLCGHTLVFASPPEYLIRRKDG